MTDIRLADTRNSHSFLLLWGPAPPSYPVWQQCGRLMRREQTVKILKLPSPLFLCTVISWSKVWLGQKANWGNMIANFLSNLLSFFLVFSGQRCSTPLSPVWHNLLQTILTADNNLTIWIMLSPIARGDNGDWDQCWCDSYRMTITSTATRDSTKYTCTEMVGLLIDQ